MVNMYFGKNVLYNDELVQTLSSNNKRKISDDNSGYNNIQDKKYCQYMIDMPIDLSTSHLTLPNSDVQSDKHMNTSSIQKSSINKNMQNRTNNINAYESISVLGDFPSKFDELPNIPNLRRSDLQYSNVSNIDKSLKIDNERAIRIYTNNQTLPFTSRDSHLNRRNDHKLEIKNYGNSFNSIDYKSLLEDDSDKSVKYTKLFTCVIIDYNTLTSIFIY